MIDSFAFWSIKCWSVFLKAQGDDKKVKWKKFQSQRTEENIHMVKQWLKTIDGFPKLSWRPQTCCSCSCYSEIHGDVLFRFWKDVSRSWMVAALKKDAVSLKFKTWTSVCWRTSRRTYGGFDAMNVLARSSQNSWWTHVATGSRDDVMFWQPAGSGPMVLWVSNCTETVTVKNLKLRYSAAVKSDTGPRPQLLPLLVQTWQLRLNFSIGWSGASFKTNQLWVHHWPRGHVPPQWLKFPFSLKEQSQFDTSCWQYILSKTLQSSRHSNVFLQNSAAN